MAEHNQQFDCYTDWVHKAPSWLTRHADYGPDFRAICFDAKGRHCRNGGDFMRARDEGAFPIRWLWPDQVAELALGVAIAANAVRPDPLGLTRCQLDCLRVLVELTDRTGVTPSFDDLKRELDLSSKSQVHRLLTALQARGWIHRQKGFPRSIRILHRPPMPDFTSPSFAMAGQVGAA